MGLIALLVTVFIWVGLRQPAPEGSGLLRLRPGTFALVLTPIVLAACWLLVSWELKA